jgi:ribonuclease VapC
MTYVLDASAVLAAIFEEPGGDFVFEVLNESSMSVINLSECYATLLDGGMDLAEATAILEALPMRIRTHRDEHARQTGRLRPLTKHLGLSLGDRACLAHALMTDIPVLTSDRRMAEANGLEGLDIRMIR